MHIKTQELESQLDNNPLGGSVKPFYLALRLAYLLSAFALLLSAFLYLFAPSHPRRRLSEAVAVTTNCTQEVRVCSSLNPRRARPTNLSPFLLLCRLTRRPTRCTPACRKMPGSQLPASH